MPRLLSGLILAAALVVTMTATMPARQSAAASPRVQQNTFADSVAALSEPGGYFDTDNLISNERSFLHVAPELRAIAVQSAKNGAYIGVGPDQNFSYISQLRPSVAILIDVRRDNLLLHLLFKAIFAEAPSRVGYLALLTGRGPPKTSALSATLPADIAEIAKYIDAAPPLAANQITALQNRLAEVIRRFGVPLSASDHATIAGFHRRFITAGLSLKFNSTGRAPQYDYPTYRDLILEVDRQGTRRSFLSSEPDFQFVKSMHARDLIIPVVGNLAGDRALTAVATFLTSSNRQVAAFYTSNVEFYLYRDGSFPRFVANLARLPRQPGSLIVRRFIPSGGAGGLIPPGYNSASLTQPIQTLVDGYAKGQFRQYWELVR